MSLLPPGQPIALPEPSIDGAHADSLLGDHWDWEDEHFGAAIGDATLIALIDDVVAAMTTPSHATSSGARHRSSHRRTRRAAPAKTTTTITIGADRAGGLDISRWVYPPDATATNLVNVGVLDTSSISETLAAAARVSARLSRRKASRASFPCAPRAGQAPAGPHRPEEGRGPPDRRDCAAV